MLASIQIILRQIEDLLKPPDLASQYRDHRVAIPNGIKPAARSASDANGDCCNGAAIEFVGRKFSSSLVPDRFCACRSTMEMSDAERKFSETCRSVWTGSPAGDEPDNALALLLRKSDRARNI
ncbi:hypothetical protein AAFG07_31355 [Bradyrhizobium sp. B097]|uniref:hypothetical protein n=1 Tax=Bradyrhizobium sp. B097 TaxID=3140244 RepID=UPI003183021F